MVSTITSVKPSAQTSKRPLNVGEVASKAMSASATSGRKRKDISTARGARLKTLNVAAGVFRALEGRFLDLTLGDPFSNLAAEEAIFNEMLAPTLRVWDNQKCVVIGRAQLARLETDVEYCSSQGLPVVRRFTAGGAVYNGPGNLNWSFFVPKGREEGRVRYHRDAKGVFMTFAGIVVKALSACSVPAEFEPPNRILTQDGKVSGMAAYISAKGAVCHGTLLLDANLEEVELLTRPREARAERRYPRSNFARVANARVARSTFVERLLDASEAGLEPGSLDEHEKRGIERLRAEKYGTERWNLGDPFSLD